MDAASIVAYVITLVGQIVWGVLGLGVCLGVWYYLFIVKNKRYWLVDIYEQKSDGQLALVQKDRLLEKKINHGKQIIYMFRKTKTESIPPPSECVRRLNGKEYCDYVRILGEYIPLVNKSNNLPKLSEEGTKQNIFKIISKKLNQIRNTGKREVLNRFVYIPLHKSLKYDIEFTPISYDVNMMRINEIDSLDKMFEATKDFWQKYGSMIIIGAGIVMVIVVAYMSFEYMQTVIQQSMGAADKISGPLQGIVERLGGSPPPS